MQDLSGKKLGNYELRERLGRGGMAEVYKAYQAGMDRFVAVKVMLGHLASDDSFIERFKREAQAVGKLRHPNIVQIFDFGIEEDVYYMAMEFLNSGTLKEYVHRKGRLSPAEAIRIMGQLSAGLDYAHKAGMIHRDLKPANVMFSDKTYQQAILTDFGIARILGAAGLTGTGMSVGTPSYMAPEAGLGEETDERVDIYALGVILYEMLTGQAPYDADTPLAVIMKHINAPLPGFTEADGIPVVIERLVLKCMAKNPNERYQTAGDLNKAVQAAVIELEHTATTKEVEHTGESPSKTSMPQVLDEDLPTIGKMPDNRTDRLPDVQQRIEKSQGFNPLFAIGAIAVIAILVIGGIFIFNNADDGIDDISATEETIVTEDIEPTGEVAEVDNPEGQNVEDMTIMPPHPENLGMLTGISPIMDEVDQLFIENNAEQAIELLTGLLTENPDNIEALFARSQLFALEWDEENIAGQDAERIIELEPNNPLGYLALSDSWLNYPEYDPEMAREAIAQAYELDPENPHIIWRDGALNDDWEVQTERFLRAEELGANGFRFIYNIANFFYWVPDYSRALPYLETSAMGNPEYWMTEESFSMLLGALMATNRSQDALNLLLEQGDIEASTDAETFADAAYVAYRAENYELAQEWADTARALSSEAYGATYVLGLMAWRVDGDIDRAMELLNSLEDTGVWTRYLNWEFGHDVYLDRARILHEAGRLEESLEFYTFAIDIYGDEDWLFEERANVYLELGHSDDARRDLQSAFEITENPEYRSYLRERITELGPASDGG